MDLHFLDIFRFEENIPGFFNLVAQLANSPILDSNRLEIPEKFMGKLSFEDWQMNLSYGLYSFGRRPQDSSQPPDIAYPVDDSRVSRRTGWFIYLPIESIAAFIKHKNNNNTVYVNGHACSFSLLQNNAKVSFPKDKAHEIAFKSEYSKYLRYEDVPYIFTDKKQLEYIFKAPKNPQHFLLYYVIGSMGEGETGKTYIAFDSSSDRLVTIRKFKFNMQNHQNKDTLLKDFFQDYRLFQIERQSFLDQHTLLSEPKNLEEASNIAHLNFSQVINAHFFVSEGQCFFCRVSEYTPSVSLFEYLELLQKNQQKLPVTHFKNIAYQILVAIHYLHTRNIVYANLSPSKVLLVPYHFGVLVKLCDFPLNEKPGFLETEIHNHKKVSKNFHFTAPEMNNVGLDNRMDVFSWGAICFFMLTSEVLFPEINSFEEWKSLYPKKIISDSSIEKIQQKIPNTLATLILQCLHHEQKARPSLNDLYNVLVG